MKTTKTWELLGSGLYGYKLGRRVTWECRKMVFSGPVKPTTTARDEFKISTTVGISAGLLDNSTTLERLRKCRDSLEPRLDSL